MTHRCHVFFHLEIEMDFKTIFKTKVDLKSTFIVTMAHRCHVFFHLEIGMNFKTIFKAEVNFEINFCCFNGPTLSHIFILKSKK